ncbi:hypothetical protein DFH28DRAFT_924866 [Melampsora americana]|nr:hypothetical protein DFH28DRAFT_924866 [Melampsora americana]
MDINTVYVYVRAQPLSKRSYPVWRSKTHTLFEEADLLEVVTDTAASPIESAPVGSGHQIRTKDLKAFNIIMGQLHHRDTTLQDSAQKLWIHLYRRYGDVNPLQVNKAWCQFYDCGMDRKTPNLLCNIFAAITQLEEAGQATDSAQCRMFILSMFPSTHRPLKEKLIHKEPSATLHEVLAHLKTAIDSSIAPANPALEDVDSVSPQENQPSDSSTTFHQSQKPHQLVLSSHAKLLPPTSLFFNPWVNENSDSSVPDPERDLRPLRVSQSYSSSTTGQTPSPSSSNEENASGASLVTNQIPQDEALSDYWLSPFDVPIDINRGETFKSGKSPREDANTPSMPSHPASAGIPGPGTAGNLPRESDHVVCGSSNVFEIQEDVKPDIHQDLKPDVYTDVKNVTQKGIKSDIKKEFESEFNKEGFPKVDYVYEEQVSSSCAAQNPTTSSHLRTKLEQKPMTLQPKIRISVIPDPINARSSRERKLLQNQGDASHEESKVLQRRKQENLVRYDAPLRQKNGHNNDHISFYKSDTSNMFQTNWVQEYHSPSAPHMKRGTMEYMRYILQNHLPRLVIHWDLRKPDPLYLFKKYHTDGKPVEVEELARYQSFYNKGKRGDVLGPQRQRDPWRAAVQLLNPSRVLPAKMTIDQLQRAYWEERGRR